MCHCTAQKWLIFNAWNSAQRKPYLGFDNSFWLILRAKVSSHMEMGSKTRPCSSNKCSSVPDFTLRAIEVTYILYFMLATSCKQSSKPQVSLTADRCRPYYWLPLIEFLGFVELMQGQRGSPLKHDPSQKKLSLSLTPSDPGHPCRAFSSRHEWKKDKRNAQFSTKTKTNILF